MSTGFLFDTTTLTIHYFTNDNVFQLRRRETNISGNKFEGHFQFFFSLSKKFSEEYRISDLLVDVITLDYFT